MHYGGIFHTGLSLRFVNRNLLDTLGYSPSDTPIAMAPIEVNYNGALKNESQYAFCWQNHPVTAALNHDKKLSSQSFVIQTQLGAIKLLGLDADQVRGDK